MKAKLSKAEKRVKIFYTNMKKDLIKFHPSAFKFFQLVCDVLNIHEKRNIAMSFLVLVQHYTSALLKVYREMCDSMSDDEFSCFFDTLNCSIQNYLYMNDENHDDWNGVVKTVTYFADYLYEADLNDNHALLKAVLADWSSNIWYMEDNDE